MALAVKTPPRLTMSPPMTMATRLILMGTESQITSPTATEMAPSIRVKSIGKTQAILASRSLSPSPSETPISPDRPPQSQQE